ncbi:MAG: hypothetical protein ACRDI3_05155, partial [Actinomycetota bacterium]
MRWQEAPAGFRVYLGVLCLTLVGTIVAGINATPHLDNALGAWIVLSLFLAFSEFMALSFHGQGLRFSLSGAEAILLPMVVALSFPQFVLGATLANAVARPARWRISPIQELFNVAQYG